MKDKASKSRLIASIELRDGKEIHYECSDHPTIGGWITLYLKNQSREYIPAEAVARIKTFYKHGR